jgi:hypothetical protein
LDALIVLGKSSKAMTAWSRGFNAHAVAAAFITARVGVTLKLLRHASKVTVRVLALSGDQLVEHHTDIVCAFSVTCETDGAVVQHGCGGTALSVCVAKL